jgi:hypothetical protein
LLGLPLSNPDNPAGRHPSSREIVERYGIFGMNFVVVFEDQVTKDCQYGSPYAFASALDVRCPCGRLIHPIPGAWCLECGLKVVEVRKE